MSKPENDRPADRPHWLLSSRNWNIAFRTAHIASMGVLLGGHAFDVPKADLLPAFWVCMATGLALGLLETGFDTLWFHQGRGLITLTKLLLLCCVPLFWEQRFAILLVVVVLASVGSHMSARYRYYSILQRRIVLAGCGPGRKGLEAELPSTHPSESTDSPSP